MRLMWLSGVKTVRRQIMKRASASSVVTSCWRNLQHQQRSVEPAPEIIAQPRTMHLLPRCPLQVRTLSFQQILKCPKRLGTVTETAGETIQSILAMNIPVAQKSFAIVQETSVDHLAVDTPPS